ncbi:hypothetical protein NPS01_16180 [Nocardioides psychrotolerans]|uniref:Lipoprotein n=1 Tax=Nocardioides psychrotolerans TaxID=1005945 RepID=A0A1I3EXU0_9ACTN|nr:hypothetical protein [Nocardioides psychrotolerans]GEP37955.1 hypothetical protein NPS01_16180 [Nocardioides psychrotolerans]SFI03783.1 hypothetical protein SAMN05216561_104123 [Nocardioides psychrotolerans]
MTLSIAGVVTAVAALSCAGLSLAACASTPQTVRSGPPVVAQQTDRPGELASFTVERLLTRRHELVVRTRGSSTCPWRVTDVLATNDGRALTVTLSNAQNTAKPLCTDDLREHREAIPLPVGVQLEQVTEVRKLDTQGASHTSLVRDVGPESLPNKPFVLDCAPGENGSSMTYEYWLEGPRLVDTPEQVAGRVLAAHPTWQVVSEETRIGADVAVFDEVGDVKGILLSQEQEEGWFLSAESHCVNTDLYR